MTINDDAVLSGGDMGAVIIVDKANSTHTVLGQITATSVLTVNAAGVTLSGTGADLKTDHAEIGALEVLKDGFLTIKDIQAINGTLKTGANTEFTLKLAQNTTGDNADTDNGIVKGLIFLEGAIFTLESSIEAQNGVTVEKGELAFGANTLKMTTAGDFAGAASAVYTAEAGGKLQVAIGGCNFGLNGEKLPALLDVDEPLSLASHSILTGGLDQDAIIILEKFNLTVSGDNLKMKNNVDADDGKLIVTGSRLTAENDIEIKNLEINSDGTVTIATDDVTAPIVYRTITIAGALTQIEGSLDIGGNSINLTGTTGDCFVRTAGDWVATTGQLTFSGGGSQAFNPGNGWSIPNLTINLSDDSKSVDLNDDKDFTVTTSLNLTAGDLDTDSDNDNKGKLHFANGVVITRAADVSEIKEPSVFDGTVDIVYKGKAAAGKTSNEMPGTATALNNLTVEGQNVELQKNITVNGKLTLAKKIDATTSNPDQSITMADGSVLELQDAGNTVLDKDLVKVGKMDLIYSTNNTVIVTSTRELGPTSTPGSHTATNVTVKGTSGIKLDADATITGVLNLDNSILNLNSQTLYLTSDFTQTTSGKFFTGTGTLALSGTGNTNFTLKGDQAVPNTVNIKIVKDAAADVVTLAGGNLDFQSTEAKNAAGVADVFGKLILTNGVFNTGDNMVVLAQGEDKIAKPMQGFERTNGVLVGKVKKLVNKNEVVERANMQFPLGTTTGKFRLATFFFDDTPASSFYLTVGHTNDSPGGTNGIPFTTVMDNITVTSYPDFGWTVTSDVTIAPSYKFDMELQAEDYAYYETDNIENVRMIRRASGSVDNQWILQGIDTNYDNQTVSAAWPLVKVIDATGGLTTQGSIFTFSQSSQAPRWSIAPSKVVLDENATKTLEFRAVDEDINQWPKIEAVGDLPSFATLKTFKTATGAVADSANLVLAPTYADSGTYAIVLRATDGTDNKDTTITVTVNNINQPATFVTVPADTMLDGGSAFTFTYKVEDNDGDKTYFAIVDSVAKDMAITAEGVLTFTAGAGTVKGLDSNFVISITDSVATPTVFTKDTVKVTFVKQVAPVFADVLPDSDVRTGDTLKYAYTATDANTPAGDAVTFTLAKEVAGATITKAGALEYIPADDMASKTIELVVVVADKAGLAVNDTAKVTVKSNILGDVDLSGKLQAIDASLTLQHVVGKTTLTSDSLALADVSGDGNVRAYDASWIFIKVMNPDTALFDNYGALAKSVVATGDADWALASDQMNENFVNVPVTVANANNIYSFEFTAEVNTADVKVEDVVMSLPRGWMMAKNIENGVIKVAAFGTKPMTASTIGNIKLEVLNKLAVSDINGSIVLNENNSRDMKTLAVRSLPREFKLSQNYPNPFNPTTTIGFQLPEEQKVVISIYDMLGNRVSTLVNQNRAAGYHAVQWNGLNANGARMASGTYFYHIQAGTYNSTKKMLLIK